MVPRSDGLVKGAVPLGNLGTCLGAAHLDVATFELASTYRLQPRVRSKTYDRIPQPFACV